MANSTIGQLAIMGATALMANKTTGAETQGGYSRVAGYCGPIFSGTLKLHGSTLQANVPVSRTVILLSQTYPDVLASFKTNPADGKFDFVGLPAGTYIVLRPGGSPAEQALVYDWEVASLP